MTATAVFTNDHIKATIEVSSQTDNPAAEWKEVNDYMLRWEHFFECLGFIKK